jgi:signal transduction histidine kinase/CheY-like chemotaxis protein
MCRCGFIVRLAGFGLSAVLVTTGISSYLLFQAQKRFLTEQIGSELLNLAQTSTLPLQADPERTQPANPSSSAIAPEIMPGLKARLESLAHTTRLHGLGPSFLVFCRAKDFELTRELEMVWGAGESERRTFFPGRRVALANPQAQALLGNAVATEPYQDFDGAWISALAPVFDRQHTVAGFVQVELPAALIDREAHRLTAPLWTSALPSAGLVLLVTLIWGIGYQRRMRRLAKALGDLASGRPTASKLVSASRDEVGDLTDGFNEVFESLTTLRRNFGFETRQMKYAREKADRANRAKGDFIAQVSHELRTTWSGVLGMNQILLETGLTPEQRGLARTVQSSAESLLGLLNDVFDFSKMEAGALTFATLDFDLNQVIESTLDLFAPQVHRKGLELIGSLDPHVPRTVRGDPGRVRQILSNLIGNAIKFTDKGEITVTMSAKELRPNQAELFFEVKDTGQGIAEETVLNLFQSVSQTDSNIMQRFGGTGLGLIIAKNLVEAMQGNIGVESAVGIGSRFWFTLKLALPPNLEQKPLDPDALYGLRALIVDDNQTFREVTGRQLLAWNVRNDAAADGMDALRFLHRDVAAGVPYGLVLIDAHLEGLDGLTLARTIQGDPALAETRVVLLTSLKDGRNIDAYSQAGVWHSLRKPLKADELHACLLQAQAERLHPKSQTGAPASPPAPLLASQPLPPPSAPSPRVLLAEDDAVNQRLALHYLKKLGCDVLVASDGLQALQILEREPVDVVFMDYWMPEMDGVQVTAKIRENQSRRQSGEEQRGPYIIAMTARAMAGDRERCLEAGMDDYVSKPLQVADFEAALGRGLAGRSPRHLAA